MKRFLKYTAACVLWLAIWKAISLIVGNGLILPSPEVTVKTFFSLAKHADFYKTAAFSLLRITIGFVAGAVLGILLGVLCGFSDICDTMFSPMRSLIKSTPVSSFILILLFWFDKNMVPSCISMLIVLPVVHSAVYEGIKSTDTLLLEAADFFHVSKTKQFFTIYFESVKSRLIAALTTAMGLAWKSGVAAEVLSVPQYSIGKGLYEGKLYLETAELFAWTLLVIILSVILENIIKSIVKVNKKYDKNR